MPLLAFVVMVAYLPGIPSAASSPRWWMISVGAFVLLALKSWRGERLFITAGHRWGAVFIVGCIASTTWSVSPQDSFGAIFQLMGLAAVFGVAAEMREHELEATWAALAAGVAVSAGFAAIQLIGFNPVQSVTAPPAGLFLNKNMLAEIAGVALVALAGSLYRYRRDPVVLGLFAACLFCALAPASRGVLLSLCGTALVWFMAKHGRWRWNAALICIGIVGAACFLSIDAQSPARWSSMEARLDIWAWTLANLKWFGWGYGSYGAIFDFEYAHNEALQIIFELGVLSAPLFLITAYVLGGGLAPERLVLIVILGTSLWSFPLHAPATAFAAVLALGALCGDRGRARRAELSGGAPSRRLLWPGAETPTY